MRIYDRIKELPCIDSHEHIGSINSIGMEKYWAFRADVLPGVEPEDTGIFDLVLSPYLSGMLSTVGYKYPFDRQPYSKLQHKEQRKVWEGLVPYLKKCRGTGLFLALDIAFKDLYGVALEELLASEDLWYTVSKDIGRNYKKGMFAWNNAVFEKANIEFAIKPVHLSYILEYGNKRKNMDSLTLEKKNFMPVLRVDDLMGYIRYDVGGLDFSHAEETLGVELKSAGDIEIMTDKAFKLLSEHDVRAIKQLQAYSRTLEFAAVDKAEADAVFGKAMVGRHTDERIKLQNYIMHCILRAANEQSMPFQIHTGMANLPYSNPVLLRSVIEKYPKVRFVLLHCYPYLSEAAFLARNYKNVYLDTAWLALQSPTILQKALEEWVDFVPYAKICLSGDCTSVEESYGAMEITRKVLARVLDDKIQTGEISEASAIDIARALLYENSLELYGKI